MKRFQKGETVTVDLTSHPSHTPLGIILAPACPVYTKTPETSTITILAGWERLHDDCDGGGSSSGSHGDGGGVLGPVQRTGQVRLGDRLVRINNVNVTRKTFREVMDLLRKLVYPDTKKAGSARVKLQSLSFDAVPPSEGSLRASRVVGDGAAAPDIGESSLTFSPSRHSALHHSQSLSGKLYSFSSTIRRARVHCPNELSDEIGMEYCEEPEDGATGRSAGGDGQYVQYEVICSLRARSGYSWGSSGVGVGSGDEVVWSVWKRYSDFKALDSKLRESHGWQIDALNDGRGLRFPSGHPIYGFFMGNQEQGFVERRRAELESYWQSLQHVGDIFDLNPNSQKYSPQMSTFLDVEHHFPHTNLKSSVKTRGGGSVALDTLSIGNGTSGGRDSDGYIPSSTPANDTGDKTPRHNNDLLNLVLSGGGTPLDTSQLTTCDSYCGTPEGPGRSSGKQTSKRKKKKRIASAAKAAYQRMDDL